MEKQIQKNIIAYFSYLEKHNRKCQEINKTCVSLLNVLLSQTKQLNLVKMANEKNHPLKKFFGFKDKVVVEMLTSIESTVASLDETLLVLRTGTRELKQKLVAFENSISEYDWTDDERSLTMGNGCQPSISYLFESAQDSWRYYHAYLSQIMCTFQTTDFQDEQSVEELLDCFREDKNYKDVVNNILMMTQFCANNEAPEPTETVAAGSPIMNCEWKL